MCETRSGGDDATAGPFFVSRRPLVGKERSVLTRLNRSYREEILRDVLLPLMEQTAPISLRILDWAVVNWSKQHNVLCSSAVPGQVTNVNHAYQVALSHWKRRLFDPFRRHHRITMRLDGAEHETTLGQANFVLFAHETGIIAYVVGNVDAIEADMTRVSRRQKRESRDARRRGVARRRTELTRAPPRMCVAYHAPTRVAFD